MVLQEKNNAFEIAKYSKEILDVFNEKHKTYFWTSFSLGKEGVYTSEMNPATGEIAISLSQNSLNKDRTFDQIEALKVMVGHELAHHVYANMRMSAINAFKAAAHNNKQACLSCCIESAADIHGRKFYVNNGGKLKSGILGEYYVMAGGNRETTSSNNDINCIRTGYLPARQRIALMGDYKSFRENDYEPVEDVVNYIDEALKLVKGKLENKSAYVAWLKAKFKDENFPNRPNRLNR